MTFYYVQRLNAAPERSDVSPFGSNPYVAKVLHDAGATVDLDYMGSSEFEGSLAITSGNRIAKVAKELRIVTQALVRPSYSEDVYFVCTSEQAASTLPQWHEWIKDPHTIEPTGYFNDDNRDKLVLRNNIVGWWALQEDLLWTRDQETAENIRSAFVSLGAK